MWGEANPQVHLVPQLVEELEEEVVLEDDRFFRVCCCAGSGTWPRVRNKVDVRSEPIQLE